MGRTRSDTSKSRKGEKKAESAELVASTPKRYSKLQTSGGLLGNVSCDDFPFFLCSQPGDSQSQIDVKWDCNSPDTYRHIQLTKRSHLGDTAENGIPDIMHTLGIDESDDGAGTPPGILLGLWTKVDDGKIKEEKTSQNKPTDDTSRGVRRKRPSRNHGFTSDKNVHDFVTLLEQAIDDHADSSIGDMLPNDSIIDKSAADDSASMQDLRQSFGAEMWSDDDLFADDSIVLKATQGFLDDGSAERRLDGSVNMSGNSKRKHFVGKTSSPFMPYLKSSRHTSPIHAHSSATLLPEHSLKMNLDDILKQSTVKNIPTSICNDSNSTALGATNVTSTTTTALKPYTPINNSIPSSMNTNKMTRSNAKPSVVNTCNSSTLCSKSDNVIRKHNSFEAAHLIPSVTTCVGTAIISNSLSVARTQQCATGSSNRSSFGASVDCGNSGVTSSKWRRYNSDDIIQSKSVISYGDKKSYGPNSNLAAKSFSHSKAQVSSKPLNQPLTVNRQNAVTPVSTVKSVTNTANTNISSFTSSTSKINKTVNSPRQRSVSLSEDSFQFDASFTDDLLCQIVEEDEFLQSQITGVVCSPGVIAPTQTIVTKVASFAQPSSSVTAVTKSISSTRSSFSGSEAIRGSTTRPCVSSTTTNVTMTTNLRAMTRSTNQATNAKQTLSNNNVVPTNIHGHRAWNNIPVGTSSAPNIISDLHVAVSTNSGILSTASRLANSVVSSNSAIVSHCTSVPSLQRGKYTFKSPPHKPKLQPDKKLLQSNSLPVRGIQPQSLPVSQFPALVAYPSESKSVPRMLSAPVKHVPGMPPAPVKHVPGIPPAPVKHVPGIPPAPVKHVPGMPPAPVKHVPGMPPAPVKHAPGIPPAPVKAVPGQTRGPVKVMPGESASNTHLAAVPTANTVAPVYLCDSFDDADEDALCTQKILDLIDQVQSESVRKPPPKCVQPANAHKPVGSVPSFTHLSSNISTDNVSNKPPVNTCLIQGIEAASSVSTTCSARVTNTTTYSGKLSFKGNISAVTSSNTANIIKPNMIPTNNQVEMSTKPAAVISNANVVRKPAFSNTSLNKSSISPPVGICKPLAQANTVNTASASLVGKTPVTNIMTTVTSTKSMLSAHITRTLSSIPLDVSTYEGTQNINSTNSTLNESSIPSSQSICSQAMQCTPEEIKKKKHEALNKLKERQRNKGLSLPRKGKP